jgi:hypothetical protein
MSLFKQQKQDESGQISTEREVGFFKGIIEIENAKEKYENKTYKNELIKNLIKMIKIIANDSGVRIDIDFESLRNPML